MNGAKCELLNDSAIKTKQQQKQQPSFFCLILKQGFYFHNFYTYLHLLLNDWAKLNMAKKLKYVQQFFQLSIWIVEEREK